MEVVFQEEAPPSSRRQISRENLHLEGIGRHEYENVLYCNFVENQDLGQFFGRDLDPERILSELSLYMNLKIRSGVDLVIFDEIQVPNWIFSGGKGKFPAALCHIAVAPICGRFLTVPDRLSQHCPEYATTAFPSLCVPAAVRHVRQTGFRMGQLDCCDFPPWS